MNQVKIGNKKNVLFLSILFLFSMAACGCARTPWPTDSWQTTAPEDHGLDPVLFELLLDEIDSSGLNIHSFLVIHQGEIILERYYSPYDESTLHETWSITKSVVSALVGTAVQQGCLNGLEVPVLDYFPDWDLGDQVGKKESITIEHLLTMSSGLYCDEDELPWKLDWAKFAMEQTLISDPGTYWYYNNCGPQILVELVGRACESNPQEFAEEQLFLPLGIDDYEWQELRIGNPNGASGLSLKPRDMAKIGYLYLRDGIWDGKRILPKDWVSRTSTAYYYVRNPLEPWDLNYGYLWWVHEDGIFAAHGLKGQFITLIPDYDLMAVSTGDISDEDFVQPQLWIRKYLIPAVESIK